MIAIVFGVGLPFTLWWNHRHRKNADPLVRFIRQSIEPIQAHERKPSRDGLRSSEPNPAASMFVDGSEAATPPSPASVTSAIGTLETDGFLIVEFGSETYMQAAKKFDRFVLERRDGSASQHFRAKGDLTTDQVLDSFDAYLTGMAAPRTVEWEANT